MSDQFTWRRVLLVLTTVGLVVPTFFLASDPHVHRAAPVSNNPSNGLAVEMELAVADANGLRDISRTAAGAAEARAAAVRYAAEGYEVEAEQLQVIEASDTDTYILPLTHELVLGGSSGRDVLGVRIGGPPDSVANHGIVLAATSDWPIWTSACFSRKDKLYGFMDTCYVLRRHDGGSTYDYFALHGYGTVWAKSGRRVTSAYVQSKPGGGSATTWMQWDPSGTVDPAGACDSITLGIDIPVSLSYSHNMCEVWNITKGTSSGDFRTTWTTPTQLTYPGSRRVAFLLDMRGLENAYPYWTISWDFSGY